MACEYEGCSYCCSQMIKSIGFQYSRWCASNGALGAAADLAISSFIKGTTLEPQFVVLVGNSYEAKHQSKVGEASQALKFILNRDPKLFASDASLGVLSCKFETTDFFHSPAAVLTRYLFSIQRFGRQPILL